MTEWFRKRLPARLDSLEGFIDGVSECARQHGTDGEVIGRIQLALEEALVNVFRHAYPDADGDVEVAFTHRKDGELAVAVTDWGRTFDIEGSVDPDVSLGLEDRKVGGLGIFLIRRMTDRIEQRTESGANVLTLTFREEKG